MFKVQFSTQQSVLDFVGVAVRQEPAIDAIHGRYRLNAKSILGLFSLDLSTPVSVLIHGNEEQEEKFISDLKEKGIEATICE